MKKQALNKYETYLYNQPKGRKFEDARIQKAYNNLQGAKSNFKNADSIRALSMDSTSPLSYQSLSDARVNVDDARNLIRRNRGTLPATGTSIESSFRTRKDRVGNAATNDVMGRPKTFRAPSVTPTLPKDKNKFFQKAKTLFKRNPALLIPAGIALGSIGYGIKKNLED